MEFVGHRLFSYAGAREYFVCIAIISHCANNMTNFQKAATAFLSVLALGIVGMIIWVYQTKWKVPLGPALQTTILTPFNLPPTWTPNPNKASTPLASNTPTSVSVTQTILPPVTSTN